MHVLQLGPYPPPEGGINRNILAIREELVDRGHTCSVIATSRSTRIVDEAGVYHPRTAMALLKLLLTLKFDVLHLHIGGDVTKRVMALVGLCGFVGRGKNVFSLHSGAYPTSDAGRAAKRNSFRGLIFRRYERIIAVNPLIAEVFGRYGVEKGKVSVIHPFVHRLPDKTVEVPAALREFAVEHSPFLITVGLLEKEYDLFMQIDSMERVLERFPAAGLMIIGSGSLEARLKDAIAVKPYADQVLLAGDVEHPITLNLIDEADILLRTTIFDGDAISVREALFLETPVIATDNGMRPENVEVIPVHDPEALVDRISAWVKAEKGVHRNKVDRSNISSVVTIYEDIVAGLQNSTNIDA